VALLDIRQRAGYLFLAVMVGHVILISAQVNARTGVPVLEAVTFGVFAEVQRASWSVVSGVRGFWGGYVGLRDVQGENEALRRQLAEAQIQLQELRALADRSRGLEQLLALRDRLNLETTAAEVIASGASTEFATLTIDKGTRHGLRADMAVIAPGGVVGRIIVPSPRHAKVQLLIDRDAAAGALVQRTRAQGVLIGRPRPGAERDGMLRLEKVSETADIVEGDTIVTSGIEGIFPKCFVIGRVESIRKNGPAYEEIIVRPAVDFSSLEEVLVVLTPPPAQEIAEESSE
jgi:rod shape-determining protein MreC